MRAAAFAVSPIVLVAALLGCSATHGSKFDEGTGGGSSGSGSGSGSGAGSGAGGIDLSGGTGSGSSSGGPSSNCAAAATLVYVLSDENDLYSFKPDDKKFTKIGQLGCSTGMSPNSMAVDRNAVAWVNYVGSDGFGDSAGALYKVSTSDASCLGMAATLPDGWFRLGMGYSSDDANTDAETLFLAATGSGFGSAGLGKLDPTMNVAPVGSFTGSLNGQNAELTGTGDGRLFGFFTTSPVQVAEIDKTSGAIKSSKVIDGVNTPNAWAFSFWGGDFYLYTADIGTSTVTRYRPSDGTVALNYMSNIGFRIVGAGVSTCAPLVPPK